MRHDLLSYISGLIMNIKLLRKDLTSAQLSVRNVHGDKCCSKMEKLLMRLRRGDSGVDEKMRNYF